MELEIVGSDDTAQVVNTLHGEMTGHMVMAVKKAIEIGRLLTEKKSEVNHGEWIPWVESNLAFGDRQARKYMRVYANRHYDSDLITGARTIDQAVALLAEPKEQPEDDGPSIDLEFAEPEVVYKTDPEQQKKLDEAAERATRAESELSRAMRELESIEKAHQEADRKLAAQKSELERLRKLDADKKKVEDALASIHELEKKKQDLFKDAESTKVVHEVLVRSREFFTKECMQIPALKLRQESIDVMRQDFEGLVELVENWLEAIKGRFL